MNTAAEIATSMGTMLEPNWGGVMISRPMKEMTIPGMANLFSLSFRINTVKTMANRGPRFFTVVKSPRGMFTAA